MTLEKSRPEINEAVRNVYDFPCQVKLDTGDSVRKILAGDRNYSALRLKTTAMVLGLKEMGLSEIETTQLLSRFSDQEPVSPIKSS